MFLGALLASQTDIKYFLYGKTAFAQNQGSKNFVHKGGRSPRNAPKHKKPLVSKPKLVFPDVKEASKLQTNGSQKATGAALVVER